jgi:hypothetical protein
LKFFIAFPIPAPISGSFPAPNIIRIMTIMMRSSGIPIPNINSSYGELDPILTTFFFKPELIGSRFRVQGSRVTTDGHCSQV